MYHSDTMITSTTTIPITGSSNYDYLIVEAVGKNSSYGDLTQYIMLDKSAYPFMWRYPISGGGRGLNFSRSGDNLVCGYDSGTEGWGNVIKNVWGGNTITPPLSAIGARTNVTVHADQWGSVYFDITVYNKDNTLVYTASRINWGFSRPKHGGVNGSFNVNASDLDNVQITNSYSTYNL